MSNSIKMQSVPLTPAGVQKPGLKVNCEKKGNIRFAEPDGLTADTILNLSGEGKLRLQNQLRMLMQEDGGNYGAMKSAYEAEQRELLDGGADIPADGAGETDARAERESRRERLNQVKNRFDEIINNRVGENSRETIQEMQRAQADLRRMKQFAQETQQRAEKEARDAKAQSAKNQAETDKDKGELLVMLESFEEYEKRKQGADGGQEADSGTARGGKRDEAKTVGDVLKGSAAQMMTSGMNKEDLKNRSIDFIDNKGLYALYKAQEEYECFMDEYERISRALDEENLTDEEEEALVLAYETKARGERYHPGGYDEVEVNRKRGLAQRQNARDVRRESLGVNPMPSVQKAAGNLEEAASDTVLDGQRQQYVDEASDEIDWRLQEKLDERNDLTKEPEELREEREEAKKEELAEAKKEEQTEDIHESVRDTFHPRG